MIDFFGRTSGLVALKVDPLDSPGRKTNWKSLLQLNDTPLNNEWGLYFTDGAFVAQTIQNGEPIWSPSQISPEQIAGILRRVPAEPIPIWESPFGEDYGEQPEAQQQPAGQS